MGSPDAYIEAAHLDGRCYWSVVKRRELASVVQNNHKVIHTVDGGFTNWDETSGLDELLGFTVSP